MFIENLRLPIASGLTFLKKSSFVNSVGNQSPTSVSSNQIQRNDKADIVTDLITNEPANAEVRRCDG